MDIIIDKITPIIDPQITQAVMTGSTVKKKIPNVDCNFLFLLLEMEKNVMDTMGESGLGALNASSDQLYNEMKTELDALKAQQKAYQAAILKYEAKIKKFQKELKENSGGNVNPWGGSYSTSGDSYYQSKIDGYVKKLNALQGPGSKQNIDINTSESKLETDKQNLSNLWQGKNLPLYQQIQALNDMGGTLISNIISSNKVKNN